MNADVLFAAFDKLERGEKHEIFFEGDAFAAGILFFERAGLVHGIITAFEGRQAVFCGDSRLNQAFERNAR